MWVSLYAHVLPRDLISYPAASEVATTRALLSPTAEEAPGEVVCELALGIVPLCEVQQLCKAVLMYPCHVILVEGLAKLPRWGRSPISFIVSAAA